MLKKISCDKFKNTHGIRPEIVFKKGLNIVLGDNEAANSIGKTTFLVIVDFVFGGTDYTKDREKNDVILNVGDHVINFEFEFKDKIYSFSRSTENPNIVTYHKDGKDEELELKYYLSMIANLYGLNNYGITLRDAVGSFFRIYGKDTINPELPIRASNQEKLSAGIDRLIKLFAVYEEIEKQQKIAKEAKENLDGMKKAIRFAAARVITSQKDYDASKKEINDLEAKLKLLAEDSDKGLLNMDSVEKEHLADISVKLGALREQRTYLETQLKSLKKNSKASKGTFANEFDDLMLYFDNVNIEKLKQVNEFHHKITHILSKEYEEIIHDTENMLKVINDEIALIEKEEMKVKSAPNVPKAILNRYADLSNQLRTITEGCNNFDKLNEYKKEDKAQKDALDKLYKDIFNNIQSTINNEFIRLNSLIYGSQYAAPKLMIRDNAKYDFYIPNDTGTGSKSAAMIMLDLILLDKTPLPAVVHDNAVITPISNRVFTKIHSLYTASEKQIIISLDRKQIYSNIDPHIIANQVILELGPNGNELFGRSWRAIKEED